MGSFAYRTHALRTRTCPGARIDLFASGSGADCGGNNAHVILRSAARTHRSRIIAICSPARRMVWLNKCKCTTRWKRVASRVAGNLNRSFTGLYITHPDGSTRWYTRELLRFDLSRVPQNTMSIVHDALRDQVITDVKQLRCNDRSMGIRQSSLAPHDRKSMQVEIRNIKLEAPHVSSYCRNRLVIVAIRSIGELPPIAWCIAFSENASGCCNATGPDNHGESGNLIAHGSQGRCGCSSSQSDRDIPVRSMLLSWGKQRWYLRHWRYRLHAGERCRLGLPIIPIKRKTMRFQTGFAAHELGQDPATWLM